MRQSRSRGPSPLALSLVAAAWLLAVTGAAAVGHAAGVGAHPAARALAEGAGSPIAPGTTGPALVEAEPAPPGSGPGEVVHPSTPAAAPPAPPATEWGAPAGAIPQPAPAVVAEAEAVPRVVRPRFLAAVAMGASVDADSSAAGKTFVSPAFAGELGFGDGPTGIDIRLFSSQASGRAAVSAPDRLALDAMMAFRPWAGRNLGDHSWGARVLRTVTANLGLSGERVAAGSQSALRPGLVTGVRVELPLGPPSGEPGELRFRLGLRRLFASEVTLGDSKSHDSTEVFGGLSVVF